MKPETITLIWIIGGSVLIIAELFMPGLIIVFFGIGAVIIGFVHWLGLVPGVALSLASWFIISLLLVLIFRRIALKFFPSESSYQMVEEDVDAIGTIVDVIKDVEENNTSGRISYSGTSWPATSNSGTIPTGGKARILLRDNICWVVEACEEENCRQEDKEERS